MIFVLYFYFQIHQRWVINGKVMVCQLPGMLSTLQTNFALTGGLVKCKRLVLACTTWAIHVSSMQHYNACPIHHLWLTIYSGMNTQIAVSKQFLVEFICIAILFFLSIISPVHFYLFPFQFLINFFHFYHYLLMLFFCSL